MNVVKSTILETGVIVTVMMLFTASFSTAQNRPLTQRDSVPRNEHDEKCRFNPVVPFFLVIVVVAQHVTQVTLCNHQQQRKRVSEILLKAIKKCTSQSAQKTRTPKQTQEPIKES